MHETLISLSVFVKPLKRPRTYILLFLTGLSLAYSLNSYCQNSSTLKTDLRRGALKAIVFYEGIGYNVSKIGEVSSFDLSELNRTYQIFKIRFNKSQQNAERYLQTIYTGYDKALLTSPGFKLLDSLYENIKITEQYIKNYIDKINSYLNATSEDKELTYLLAFQFWQDPNNEFSSGYYNKYNTKNNPKAKGTDWTIKYPKSWLCAEGERPNIIQKMTSEFGNGNAGIILMVKDLELPPNYKMSQNELNDFFTITTAKSLIESPSELLSFKKIAIENLPAGEIIYKTIASRMDNEFYLKSVTYYFLYNNQFYMLSGNIVGRTMADISDEKWQGFKKLFDRIGNSIVLNNKY